MGRQEIYRELEAIRARAGGVLRPRDVVETARDPDNPLHTHFEWNDNAAAEQYRLEQARRLIRVPVTVPKNRPIQVRAYVSLPNDRAASTREGGQPGSGIYRHIDDVLQHQTQRQLLLEQARAEFNQFLCKYHQILDLLGLGEYRASA